MADTSTQLKVEKFIINTYLPDRFKQSFQGKKLDLVWGGKFNFDAVSDDNKIVGNISTSSARTARGRHGSGKILKIKSDSLYLLNVKDVLNHLLVFTEKDMLEYFEKEKKSGRFPPDIELIHVELPKYLKTALKKSRQEASEEVSPQKKK